MMTRKQRKQEAKRHNARKAYERQRNIRNNNLPVHKRGEVSPLYTPGGVSLLDILSMWGKTLAVRYPAQA